jgi:hypothetical protein
MSLILQFNYIYGNSLLKVLKALDISLAEFFREGFDD